MGFTQKKQMFTRTKALWDRETKQISSSLDMLMFVHFSTHSIVVILIDVDLNK